MTGVRAFECALSSLTSDVVHPRRTTCFFFGKRRSFNVEGAVSQHSAQFATRALRATPRRRACANAAREVRDAVDAEQPQPHLDDELLLAVLRRRLDDPGETLRPVMAVPGDQPHAFALALDAQAVAVIFDFVNPVGISRHGLCRRGQAELERFQHGQQIGCGTAFWSLPAYFCGFRRGFPAEFLTSERMTSMLVRLLSKPFGSTGISSGAALLQSGQGSPAPPQPQAFGPSQGRSGWFSQTQWVLSQRVHVIRLISL